MSDPVTNVEIEDVLSSIRRLVSDGDKARTRNPAPVVAKETPVETLSDDAAEAGESKPDKFVLTPAFMVVDNDAKPDIDTAAQEDHNAQDDDGDEDSGWVEEVSAEQEMYPRDAVEPGDETEDSAAEVAADHVQPSDAADTDSADPEGAHDDAPETDYDLLKNMVWDSVNEARKAGLAAVPPQADVAEAESIVTTKQSSDRSKLIASIAELEAAVTNDVQDFEPDGSEIEDEVMGETIAWPGSVARSFEDVQDAEEAEHAVPESEAEIDDDPISFEHREAAVEPAQEDVSGAGEQHADDYGDDDDYSDDGYGDDDLDGLLDVGDVSLDEDALRALVSDVVRQELTGPLGERITRNVRKLVRREIYRILSSKEFD
jgi:hypothetical protein